MPYFCLERYSGIQSASQSGQHPVRTLLQARFISVRKDRDMQQAVCQMPDTPKGHCMHIAQIWYLLLDDSLLVTCARAPLSQLQGASITVKPIPVPDSPRKQSPPRVIVFYGDAVMWSLRMDDCRTWFSLLSHFAEFWPRQFQIQHNGKVISGDQWPRIAHNAAETGNDVHLTFQMSSAHKSTHIHGHGPTDRGVLPDDSALQFQGAQGSRAGRVHFDPEPITELDDKTKGHPKPRYGSEKTEAAAPGVNGKIPQTKQSSLLEDSFHIFSSISAKRSRHQIERP